jgi:hypothetical protein
MTREVILLPILALVLLTAIVWVLLYLTRTREMRARRIHPQAVATRTQGAAALQDTAASDNFMNLFEMPVLFYVLTILLYATDMTDRSHLVLAWVYVALRYAHTFVHVTYNRVMHRFLAYLLSGVVLWVMWGRFAAQLLDWIN